MPERQCLHDQLIGFGLGGALAILGQAGISQYSVIPEVAVPYVVALCMALTILLVWAIDPMGGVDA